MNCKDMGYDELMGYAGELIDEETTPDAETAQAVALMAVADRLDRLCEVLSRRGGR